MTHESFTSKSWKFVGAGNAAEFRDDQQHDGLSLFPCFFSIFQSVTVVQIGVLNREVHRPTAGSPLSFYAIYLHTPLRFIQSAVNMRKRT